MAGGYLYIQMITRYIQESESSCATSEPLCPHTGVCGISGLSTGGDMLLGLVTDWWRLVVFSKSSPDVPEPDRLICMKTRTTPSYVMAVAPSTSAALGCLCHCMGLLSTRCKSSALQHLAIPSPPESELGNYLDFFTNTFPTAVNVSPMFPERFCCMAL